MSSLNLSDDRSMRVPPGYLVRTTYVPVFSVRLACRERMAVGDVANAFQKRLQLGCDEPFPCPTGHWDGSEFVICDGRHQWVASVMLGKSHILVSWLEAGLANATSAEADAPSLMYSQAPPELCK